MHLNAFDNGEAKWDFPGLTSMGTKVFLKFELGALHQTKLSSLIEKLAPLLFTRVCAYI